MTDVTFANMRPQAWADPTAAIDFHRFSDVEIQIVGTPGGALTPYRSFDGGTTWSATNFSDKDGNLTATVAAAGIYAIDGGCLLKITGTLAPATLFVRAGA